MTKVLIWCHGGCFGGGNVNYDSELRNFLQVQHDWKIICVDFVLDDWDRAISDIETTVKLINKSDMKVIIGGVSSGGMMAHEVANRLELPAILLCPVLAPFDRHESLAKDLQDKQLKFFHTLDNMKKVQDSIQPPNAKRYFMYGKTDKRAPVTVYKDWLEDDLVKSDEVDGGHEICNDPPFNIFATRINELIN